MTHVFVFLFCLFAFAALAFAMTRHQVDIFGCPFPRRLTYMLRIAGWAGLLLGLWIAMVGEGLSMGLVIYSGHTSLCAGIVYCTLIMCGRYTT